MIIFVLEILKIKKMINLKDVMKNLLWVLLFSFSVVYGQYEFKWPSTVYMKDGSIKKGKSEIKLGGSRVAGVSIRGGKDEGILIFKPDGGGKKEKLAASDIEKIVYEYKNEKKNYHEIYTYLPIKIKGKDRISCELIENYLYRTYEPIKNPLALSGTPGDKNRKAVYYVKEKDGSYTETTLSKLTKDNKCEKKKNETKEKRLVRCIQSNM